jgi:hypothetical protein
LTAAGESTIAAVNIGDVKLNDATTTSVNFTKVIQEASGGHSCTL